MKNYLYFCIVPTILVSAMFAFCMGFITCKSFTDQELNNIIDAYDTYNKNAEILLDTLDMEYGWVDSYDPQEYYQAKERLDSLLCK